MGSPLRGSGAQAEARCERHVQALSRVGAAVWAGGARGHLSARCGAGRITDDEAKERKQAIRAAEQADFAQQLSAAGGGQGGAPAAAAAEKEAGPPAPDPGAAAAARRRTGLASLLGVRRADPVAVGPGAGAAAVQPLKKPRLVQPGIADGSFPGYGIVDTLQNGATKVVLLKPPDWLRCPWVLAGLPCPSGPSGYSVAASKPCAKLALESHLRERHGGKLPPAPQGTGEAPSRPSGVGAVEPPRQPQPQLSVLGLLQRSCSAAARGSAADAAEEGGAGELPRDADPGEEGGAGELPGDAGEQSVAGSSRPALPRAKPSVLAISGAPRGWKPPPKGAAASAARLPPHATRCTPVLAQLAPPLSANPAPGPFRDS